MCVYLYIDNKYTQYTHILCKQKTFILEVFQMINHDKTALNIYSIYIYVYIYIYV